MNKIDTINQMSNGEYDESDYKFLNISLELNDYQFSTIFNNGRQIGKTWAEFMKICLSVKKNKNLIVNSSSIGEISSNHDKIHKLKELTQFISLHFPEDIQIVKSSNTSIELEYAPTKFKQLHPEEFI